MLFLSMEVMVLYYGIKMLICTIRFQTHTKHKDNVLEKNVSITHK